MSQAGGGDYVIRNSGAMAQTFIRLQRLATRQGRGPAMLRAARTAYERMQRDPLGFGDPNYRLPALKLQVRCAVVAPLVIHFAVSEERPEVYIKALKLL